MAKRMRLPNGFGQITKLKQRLRNPFRAMVTIGWNEDGKPIRKILGYYKTYNEAYIALIENKNSPEDNTKEQNITMKEMYEAWSDDYYKRIKSPKGYASAWSHIECLYDMKVKDVKARHIKEAVEGDMPSSCHRFAKQLLSLMFDYAVSNAYTDRNYARLSDIYIEDTPKESIHKSFSEDEISLLWNSIDRVSFAKYILFAIYTGFRPAELIAITKDSVNIDDMVITGGMKTKAGTNRVVPIHSCIQNITKKMYESENEDLIPCETPSAYRWAFDKALEECGISSHKPHDTRKTFVTLAKKYNMDEYAIKRIAGHSINDITERIYTDRDLSWFKSEIEKIKVLYTK